MDLKNDDAVLDDTACAPSMEKAETLAMTPGLHGVIAARGAQTSNTQESRTGIDNSSVTTAGEGSGSYINATQGDQDESSLDNSLITANNAQTCKEDDVIQAALRDGGIKFKRDIPSEHSSDGNGDSKGEQLSISLENAENSTHLQNERQTSTSDWYEASGLENSLTLMVNGQVSTPFSETLEPAVHTDAPGTQCIKKEDDSNRVSELMDIQPYNTDQPRPHVPVDKGPKVAADIEALGLASDQTASHKRKTSESLGPPNKRARQPQNVAKHQSRKSKPKPVNSMKDLIESLRPQDAIQARQELGDIGEVQAIEATKKGEQMKLIRKNAPEDNGKWRVKGLKTSLYDYQVVGSAWLLNREKSATDPKGGILADDMGMGKTIQILTCMILNPPTKAIQKTGGKATLIVVPSEVHIGQWKQQVRQHVEMDDESSDDEDNEDEDGDLYHYRTVSKVPASYLRQCKYVLTTYHQVVQAYPSSTIREKLDALNTDDPEWKKLWKHNAGALLKTNWYRVVLDEADKIKNISSAGMLQQFPGTEILWWLITSYYNKASIACCNLKARHKWALTGTPMPNGLYELRSYFKFLGLKPKLEAQAFEERFGSIVKDTSEGRLKQMLPQLMLRRRVEMRIQQEIQPALNAAAANLNNRALKGKALSLMNLLSLRLRQACGHILCAPCFEELISESREVGVSPKCLECNEILRKLSEDSRGDSRGEPVYATHPTESDDFCNRPFRRSLVEGKGKCTKRFGSKQKSPQPGDDHLGNQPCTKPPLTGFLTACDADPHTPLPPSAKTVAVKDILLQIQQEAPDDKTIVFVEFAVTAKILGRVLQAEGIPFLYFWGGMSSDARGGALKYFHESDETKVLISNRRCGGVCLNLTCANRVIMVDPWWNHASEEQAFGRVFRHGQKKETHFTRLVVQDSIDERILAIQARKTQEIDGAIAGESNARSLSMEEKTTLFGKIIEKSDGTVRIEADYKRLRSDDYNPDSDRDTECRLIRSINGHLGQHSPTNPRI
ncbi:P-loop containing nucleoside triphosphate hydrolase protein [Xylariaceae sp. FL0016]|nr:P-loop containing nucleoside triphosphate hydrolase protein [Xylariaceae sp. FL0016]